MAFPGADVNSPRYPPSASYYSSSSPPYVPGPCSPGYSPLQFAGSNPPYVLASIEPEGDPLIALQTATKTSPQMVRLMRDEILGLEDELEQQTENITFLEDCVQLRNANITCLRAALARVKYLADTLLSVLEAQPPSPSLSPPPKKRKREEAELLGPIDPEAGRGAKRACKAAKNYKA